MRKSPLPHTPRPSAPKRARRWAVLVGGLATFVCLFSGNDFAGLSVLILWAPLLGWRERDAPVAFPSSDLQSGSRLIGNEADPLDPLGAAACMQRDEALGRAVESDTASLTG